MKRRDFFKRAGVGAAAMAAAPTTMVMAANEKGTFTHDPSDYGFVSEEAEEFQEYEIDVPEDWAEEEIIWG